MDPAATGLRSGSNRIRTRFLPDLDPAKPGTDPDKPDPDPVAAEYVPGLARSSFITKKIR